MKIDILAVGRIKDRALAELCAGYAARITHYGHQLNIEEVRREAGTHQEAQILSREAGRLRSRLEKHAGAYTVALDPAGESCDSPGLARRLGKLADQGIREMVFIIGGHLGLDREFVAHCNWTVSLSPLTFTHEIARLILLEQIYRANTILRGEPYHK